MLLYNENVILREVESRYLPDNILPHWGWVVLISDGINPDSLEYKNPDVWSSKSEIRIWL